MNAIQEVKESLTLTPTTTATLPYNTDPESRALHSSVINYIIHYRKTVLLELLQINWYSMQTVRKGRL